jgi:hypothetical protein
MPLILTIISYTFFALSGVDQCNPREAERECYSVLCRSSQNRPIPIDHEELIKASESHEFELPQGIIAQAEKIENLSSKLQSNFREILSNDEGKSISEVFIESPVGQYRQFMNLFNSDFKCIEVEGKCNLIFSDVSGLPEESKELIKRWSEMTYLYRDGPILSLEKQKKHLLRALADLENEIPAKNVRSEKKKILGLKPGTDLLEYLGKTSWIRAYENKIKRFLSENRPTLDKLIKIKISEFSQKDFSLLKRRLFRSCQIADYLGRSLAIHATEEKFKTAVEQGTNLFKQNFLAKLSQESARELTQELQLEKFKMIKMESSYLPGPPNYGPHTLAYRRPENSKDVIADIQILKNFDHQVCSLRGFLPGDSYNYATDEFRLSPMTVANNYDGVITHELGHWISARMIRKKMSGHSYRKLLKVRECVSSYYPQEKMPSTFLTKHPKDHLFVEEDFADWVASISGPFFPGLHCEIDQMLVNLGKVDLPSSYLPRTGTANSGQLFREITTTLNRGGSLPDSCKKLVEAYPKLQPKKCEW